MNTHAADRAGAMPVHSTSAANAPERAPVGLALAPETRTLRAAGRLCVAVLVLALALPATASASSSFTASESGRFAFAGACVAGVKVVIAGAGRGSHVGNYTYEASECVDLITNEISEGIFTMTAANGDVLQGTYSGHASATTDPTVVAFDDVAVIRGGSGRFARATGQFDIHGTADLATGTYNRRLSGSISR